MLHSLYTLPKNITAVIVLLTLLRLATAPFFGYGVDEAHYVLYAQHLALSYFDHPPLVGWVHYLFSFIGHNEFLARVPAIALGALNSYLFYGLLKDKNKSAAFWAVIALNASFVLDVLFLTLMPDSLLISGMLLLIYIVKLLESNNSILNYLLLGIVLGIMGLSKYTAILFVPGIAGYSIWVRRWDLLLTPKILYTFFFALIAISPVLIWNIDNDFSSFTYQASHVVGNEFGNFKNFFLSLTRQFGAYNPFLFLIAFYGLYKAYRSNDFKLEISLGITILLFMFFSQYRFVALPHWISPFFTLFIPIGTYYFYLNQPKGTKIIVSISLILTIIIHLELIAKLGTFPNFNSPFRDIAGWENATKQASNELVHLNNKNAALAVTHWNLASRAIIYSSHDVFLIDDRKDQFDLWEKTQPIGKDLLFINPHTYHKDINSSYKCDSTVKIGEYNATLNGGIVDVFSYELCKNFTGIRKPSPSIK
ncbi:MAG: glycosyltransferase family 39 protein [Sulfuricurvum sp.]|nr:glycosyltransferase family 39 protein [Sulfuricurvum sp.]